MLSALLLVPTHIWHEISSSSGNDSSFACAPGITTSTMHCTACVRWTVQRAIEERLHFRAQQSRYLRWRDMLKSRESEAHLGKLVSSTQSANKVYTFWH